MIKENSPRPLDGLSLLDIGSNDTFGFKSNSAAENKEIRCGGGFASEVFASLGADVLGVDASEGNAGDVELSAEQIF